MRLRWRHPLYIAALIMLAACALEPKAILGSADAQYRLGLKYLVAAPPDYEKAAYWLRRAAVQGNTEAQKQLGRFYAVGWGGEDNPVQAYLWLQLASVLDPEADRDRHVLARGMTKEQLNQAQALAAAFQPGQAPDAELEAKRQADSASQAEQKQEQTATAKSLGTLKKRYFVRLGTFASRANVKRLETRLRGQGQRAETETVSRGGHDLIVVRAGPYADAASARAALRRLTTKLGIQGELLVIPSPASRPAAGGKAAS
jgi:TPR repeat protein